MVAKFRKLGRHSSIGLVLRCHRQGIPNQTRFSVSANACPRMTAEIQGFPLGGSGSSRPARKTETIFLDQGVGKQPRSTPGWAFDMSKSDYKTLLIYPDSMQPSDCMSADPITYAYPPPEEWRKYLIPDGVQLRIETRRGSASGVALVIIHADLISETFGEGDPLKVARENSDAILERAKQAIESSGSVDLNFVCHLYDPKNSPA